MMRYKFNVNIKQFEQKINLDNTNKQTAMDIIENEIANRLYDMFGADIDFEINNLQRICCGNCGAYTEDATRNPNTGMCYKYCDEVDYDDINEDCYHPL